MIVAENDIQGKSMGKSSESEKQDEDPETLYHSFTGKILEKINFWQERFV